MSLETSELARKFRLSSNNSHTLVSGVQLDSRLIVPGDLFIAAEGERSHGIDFLERARAAGAVAVLTDEHHVPNGDFPTLIHPNPKQVAGEIAGELYGTRTAGMRLFGVTGTNGKTSTVSYLQQILTQLQVSCGLSASTNRIVGNEIRGSELTTPEVTQLHKMLAEMRAAGQMAAVIEVSAQAMIRNRVDAILFETVGFTNLSRDHLDDFGSMDQYLAAKARLFTSEFAKSGVILNEDPYAAQLITMCQIPIVTIGEGGDYRYRFTGQQLSISGKQTGVFSFTGGALMAKNLVVAIVMLLEAGFDVDALSSAVSNANLNVSGRLQRVSEKKPAVFVDYAHTPAGVEAAVQEIASRYPSLTVVLGASGNRDQGKRAAMAEAGAKASTLIITDQHPRDEDPAAIRETLVSTAQKIMDSGRLFEISDPAAAIAKAIELTSEDSAVLWCGPGHLKYREISGTKVPFDAIEIARRAVERD